MPELKTCDACGRLTDELDSTRGGRYGNRPGTENLCRDCYRARSGERNRRKGEAEAKEAMATAVQASGPPYPWPRCKLCGEDVNQHGLGYSTCDGKRRRFCSSECRLVSARLQRVRKGDIRQRAVRAINQGARIADLPDAEAEAYRDYRRDLYRTRKQCPENAAFREARLRAGLTQAELARRIGVSKLTVHYWEVRSARPRSPAARAAAIEILGTDPWKD